jgi:hypothetical protein
MVYQSLEVVLLIAMTKWGVYQHIPQSYPWSDMDVEIWHIYNFANLTPSQSWNQHHHISVASSAAHCATEKGT